MSINTRTDGVRLRDEGALRRLEALPSLRLMLAATPVEEMGRLRDALGGGPRLFVKRDDAIPFGFGGNKVRKLELLLEEAIAGDADTLVTVGSVQSNHARVTAAIAAKLGLGCVLVLDGDRSDPPRANAVLDDLLGAQIEYIDTRADRSAAMEATVARLRRDGRRPYAIPLGASTPLGALGFVRAVGEILQQGPPPDVIVHASSSGGTQAGLVAGCVLHGLDVRIIGISADEPAEKLSATVRRIVAGMGEIIGCDGEVLVEGREIEVDERFIGDGYGLASAASHEAQHLAARTEALFVDHSYTAKALAALIAYLRDERFREDDRVLFWHTGGQVGVFA